MRRLFLEAGRLLLGLTMLLLACAVPRAVLRPDAARVQVARAEPPDGFVALGPIQAMHPSYEGALVELRNAAAQRHSDFVKLISVVEPHAEGDGCYEARFLLRGIAYRSPTRAAYAPEPPPAAATNGPSPR